MRTFSAKAENVKRNWYVIDAQGKHLGRLASEVAVYLRGKHKPEYTRHVDTGDYVIVLNAAKVAVSGNKEKGKIYYRHTQYIGGLKTTPFDQMLKRSPERVIELAVKGMMPKNPLGREMQRKLKVYAGAEHPHEAQEPRVMEKRVGGSNV